MNNIKKNGFLINFINTFKIGNEAKHAIKNEAKLFKTDINAESTKDEEPILNSNSMLGKWIGLPSDGTIADIITCEGDEYPGELIGRKMPDVVNRKMPEKPENLASDRIIVREGDI